MAPGARNSAADAAETDPASAISRTESAATGGNGGSDGWTSLVPSAPPQLTLSATTTAITGTTAVRHDLRDVGAQALQMPPAAPHAAASQVGRSSSSRSRSESPGGTQPVN